jgi:acetyl esterase/lipase
MAGTIEDLTPMLDPELAEAFRALPHVNLVDRSLEELIAWRKAGAVTPTAAPAGVVIDNLEIPGRTPQAPRVKVRVYRPAGALSAPVVLWIHGGGFVGGNVDGSDPLLIRWVRGAGCAAVSVDYRLAPEHPYPAAPDDCYATLQWIARSPKELGVGPSRIAVAGASAGGCLAAAVALMARDLGGPKLCHQFLVIPVLDDRYVTPSSTRIGDPRVWNVGNSRAGWRYYLGARHGRDVPTYAAPAREANLSGLPPTTIHVEELDGLRDEAVDYASRLTLAGVRTELVVYPGTFHGHFAFIPQAAISKRTARDMDEVIQRICTGRSDP